MNKNLIVILGPTGVGKSDVAVELAGYFNTEIISADSRQFYSEMRIGTAVPSDHLLGKARHHLSGLFQQRSITAPVSSKGLSLNCSGTSSLKMIKS